MTSSANLIGKRIKAIRRMPPATAENFGWDGSRGIVLVLEDGTMIVPSRDEEGNGPGVLYAAKSGGSHSQRGMYLVEVTG